MGTVRTTSLPDRIGTSPDFVSFTMSNIDFIHDRETFTLFWQRARECAEKLAVIPASDLLHFDSSNIGTQIFRDLIRIVLYISSSPRCRGRKEAFTFNDLVQRL